MDRIIDFQAIDLIVVGQGLGIVLSIINFFVYCAKTRQGILLTKLVCDVGYCIQQCMLGTFTGALINGIGIFRDLVFYHREQKKWASRRFWLWFFVIVMGLSPVFTWVGPASLLPASGSAVAVFGFYCRNPHHTRLLIFLATVPWLIYAIIMHNYGLIVTNIIQAISVTLGLIRDYRSRSAANRSS